MTVALIKAARKALTGIWKDVSAQELYDQCVKKRGTIESIPPIPGTFVFMYDKTKARLVHVGIFVGNGDVIESRGGDYGVVKTKLSQRAWTHWGQPDWIEFDLVQDGTKVITGSAEIILRLNRMMLRALQKQWFWMA